MGAGYRDLVDLGDGYPGEIGEFLHFPEQGGIGYMLVDRLPDLLVADGTSLSGDEVIGRR